MENKWKIFLDVLTAFSVIAIIVDYGYPSLSKFQQEAIYAFDLFVVSLLAVDFYTQLKKSNLPLLKFLVKHWYEIPSMLPLILFSTLEHEFIIGTLVRSFRLVGLFRIIHLFFRTITIFEKNRLMYIMAFAFVSVFLGAFAEYILESPVHGSKINSFSDALWWSIVTVTTVGYGDIYPVTTLGRIIASILMIIGIMILGLFVSTLGESLIESRLNKFKDKEISTDHNYNKNNKEKNYKYKNPINVTSYNSDIKKETLLLIKNKLDSLDSLGEDEFNMLLNLIKTVYYSKSKL